MWSLFEGTAWAQGVAAGAQGSEYGTLIQMAPIVGIIAIFYFLIIRPQTQKASEHTKMLGALKKNDEIVTTGGLIGRITELGDKIVTLEDRAQREGQGRKGAGGGAFDIRQDAESKKGLGVKRTGALLASRAAAAIGIFRWNQQIKISLRF